MRRRISERHTGLNRDFPFAFTLVELLVVIAIIAILASLLLPALSRAKESVRSACCVNNLHQLAVASMTYSLDANGNLPSFRDWLYDTRLGDLTTGKLYPYLKSKQVYSCPTDVLDLALKKNPAALPSPPTGFAGRIATRDYSYAMNCGICHATDLSKFIEPSRTLLYMEGNLAPNDYSGQVGPTFVAQLLAFRHRNRGHLVMADLRVETMDKRAFEKVQVTKRFWFPTEDTSGPNGMSFWPPR